MTRRARCHRHIAPEDEADEQKVAMMAGTYVECGRCSLFNRDDYWCLRISIPFQQGSGGRPCLSRYCNFSSNPPSNDVMYYLNVVGHPNLSYSKSSPRRVYMSPYRLVEGNSYSKQYRAGCHHDISDQSKLVIPIRSFQEPPLQLEKFHTHGCPREVQVKAPDEFGFLNAKGLVIHLSPK